MSKKIILAVLGTAAAAIALYFFWNFPISKNGDIPEVAGERGIKAVVYKSPTCGCCGRYVSYLEKNGFKTETVITKDMNSIKKKYKIPGNMESCHTVVIGNYFIEGHIPIAAVDKILEEKPKISGIALPGMPSGAPGMPGRKLESFKIYSLLDGTPSEFMVIN